ncbi:MAG TPA: ATP-binding protein, partial [Myxococcales bacterium]|nr:ATP-binding protein [Myxococcales bacterium]
ELVGRNASQMRGRPFRELFPELPHDAPVFQMMDEVLRSGEAYTADEYKVMILRRGMLEDVYFLFTCQPIHDEQGKVTEIMTVAVDVTAQVLSRRRIETLMQQQLEADKRKDEFLATLAHELRNPMAAISMALMLLEKTSDPVKSARHREVAQRQVGNLVRLVDDLLDVSRITRGAVELRKEQIDLRNVVANAVAAARVSLDARNHQVEVSTAPGGYLLLADPTRLEQVVTNLLTNAAKYTEPGGLVSVNLAVDSGEAVLRVRDTGRGIPPEMLGKVFEMFVQVQQTIDRSKGGLGLGLTLVKRLVEMHGGTVSAHSEGAGKGSEFVVRLPMPSLSITPYRPAMASAGAAPSRRILLIEDSEDIRETLAELFQELGHQVATAANGLDGVAQALALRPDVAFVDIGLPGVDGYEVARRIRAAPGGKDLYLIALTGYGGAEAMQTALDAGFDLHITKPVDAVNLPKLLNRR